MCGIAGIINTTPKTFDYSTFCTLGIANDYRGGDSCGIFIDGKYEYGIKDTKFFQNLFLTSKLINQTDQCKIALVHCRKASVGTISISTAQPVVLTDEKGKVLYVVMHNGTIHNYEELAKKYIPEIDIKGMTDSQVMTHIFYHKGYDVLDEYTGGAVFAIIDYRKKEPETLLFKGASKKTSYSKDFTEERPLFYCLSKGELIFSSLGIWLCALRKDQPVYSLKENTLVKFSKNKLVVIRKYSRENVYQDKKATSIWPSFNSYEYIYDIINNHQNDNTYYYHGKKIHGQIYMTSYGRVYDNPSDYAESMYFYQGIALKNKDCFSFLTYLAKKFKLSPEEFFEAFQNLIRYLSIDQVYFDTVWVKAVSPTKFIPFTGGLQQLTSSSEVEYVNGMRRATTWGKKIQDLKSLPTYDINFKLLREKCESLMKLVDK